MLSRLRADEGKALLKGIPQLWHVVLDRMAADEDLPDSAAALREHLDPVLPDSAARQDAGALCARVLLDESRPIRLSELPDDLPDYAVRLLRHRAVRVLLAADVIAETVGTRPRRCRWSCFGRPRPPSSARRARRCASTAC